jgi:DNA-binding NtrC family response regulator
MKRNTSILIVDDEPLFGTTTQQFLQSRGFDVQYAPDGHEGEKSIRTNRFDLIVADLDMPGNRQLEFLKTCRMEFTDIPFIVVTGRPSLPSAIEGIRLGIHDYFLKPIDLDDLLHSVERARRNMGEFAKAGAEEFAKTGAEESAKTGAEESAKTGAEEPALTPAPTEQPFHEIIGESLAALTLKHLAGRAARSNATVLIRGESGTGKELLAREIHSHSLRKTGPFVTVDCASIPENLIESALFGTDRGQVNNSMDHRIGFVAAANGGTLFLDQIGDIPLAIQSKLLRLLQFGTYTPIGSTDERKADVRILAATQYDLASKAREGAFRTDLYYRLAVLELICPPLRDRHGDIRLLANVFMQRIAQRDQTEPFEWNSKAIEALGEHRWPGNIRELQNVTERIACLATASQIDAMAVNQAIENKSTQSIATPLVELEQAVSPSFTHHDFLSNNEKLYIEDLMRRNQGNVSRAAKEANMSRQGLHKALLRLGINASNFRF